MDCKITYPNWSMKAISFTLDDGNMRCDSIVLDILRPHGIKGTFNLCLTEAMLADGDKYRKLYDGYGIADHCAHHPFVFSDDKEYTFTDEPFDPDTADETKIYRSPDLDGLFLIKQTKGWRRIVTPEKYIEYSKESRETIEKLFGRRIDGFVWPFGEQHSRKVKEYLYSNYASVRRTGCIGDSQAFSVPLDFHEWSYTANHSSLLKYAELFRDTEDDGELKFFVFGVHSIDFERSEKLDDLRTFAELYGDRPDEFWYAAVEDIFDYVAAARQLERDDSYIKNNSDRDIHLLIGDKRVVLHGGDMLTDEDIASL